MANQGSPASPHQLTARRRSKRPSKRSRKADEAVNDGSSLPGLSSDVWCDSQDLTSHVASHSPRWSDGHSQARARWQSHTQSEALSPVQPVGQELSPLRCPESPSFVVHPHPSWGSSTLDEVDMPGSGQSRLVTAKTSQAALNGSRSGRDPATGRFATATTPSPSRHDSMATNIFHEPAGFALPDFSVGTGFAIYPWPYGNPKDLTNLGPSDRKAKTDRDIFEGTLDIDDGSDDWEQFSGNPTYYGSASAMARIVARTLVQRAKRAYRCGKTFAVFESEERTIDSEAQARQLAAKESDPRRKKVQMEEALDNAFRLAVLDDLKVRLCEEIWSHTYPTTTAERLVSVTRSVISKKGAHGKGKTKKDSVVAVDGKPLV